MDLLPGQNQMTKLQKTAEVASQVNETLQQDLEEKSKEVEFYKGLPWAPVPSLSSTVPQMHRIP